MRLFRDRLQDIRQQNIFERLAGNGKLGQTHAARRHLVLIEKNHKVAVLIEPEILIRVDALKALFV